MREDLKCQCPAVYGRQPQEIEQQLWYRIPISINIIYIVKEMVSR
jgi:hypothetical protein